MRYLSILAIIVVLKLFTYSCNATSLESQRNFTVSSWSGAWTFTGFAVGPSSGEYYHLLSTSVDNQCAIIKETSSGTVTWAKMYQTDQCAGLSIDSTETYAYFANDNASYFGVNQVSCSTGESISYQTSANFNTSGGVANIDAKNNPGNVVFGGNLINSTSGIACVINWNVSSLTMNYLPSIASTLEAAFAIPDGF